MIYWSVGKRFIWQENHVEQYTDILVRLNNWSTSTEWFLDNYEYGYSS